MKYLITGTNEAAEAGHESSTLEEAREVAADPCQTQCRSFTTIRTSVGDNFAVEFTAAGPSNVSIYLSGRNAHVTTMSSAGDTVIHEQGDYTTSTDLGAA